MLANVSTHPTVRSISGGAAGPDEIGDSPPSLVNGRDTHHRRPRQRRAMAIKRQPVHRRTACAARTRRVPAAVPETGLMPTSISPGPGRWPLVHRVGGWVIHFPAVVGTSWPSTSKKSVEIGKSLPGGWCAAYRFPELSRTTTRLSRRSNTVILRNLAKLSTPAFVRESEAKIMPLSSITPIQ